MVEHGAQGIFAVGRGEGQFHGLRDGAAQGALVVGILGKDILAGTGAHGRGGSDGGTEGLHDGTAVGLLVVAHFHHVYGAVQAELLGGIAEGAAPLAGAGFGGDVGDAFFLGIVGLCQGRIELVAAGGAHALILEIDVGGGAQGFFQLVGTHQRGATVGRILLAYRLRDGNPLIGLVQFLTGALFHKHRVEVFGLQGLLGGGVQERKRLVGHHRLDVEVMGGDFALGEDVLFLSHNACY